MYFITAPMILTHFSNMNWVDYIFLLLPLVHPVMDLKCQKQVWTDIVYQIFDYYITSALMKFWKIFAFYFLRCLQRTGFGFMTSFVFEITYLDFGQLSNAIEFNHVFISRLLHKVFLQIIKMSTKSQIIILFLHLILFYIVAVYV